MAEGFERAASIEGFPHSADVLYQHTLGEAVTDFKVLVRPPVKVSDHFWEIYGGKDSFTKITEEAATPNFTYYEMTVDYRNFEDDPSEEARVTVGVDTIGDLIESVNRISKGDIT